MRRLLWVPLLLAVTVTPASADAITVRLLEQQHTTNVLSTWYELSDDGMTRTTSSQSRAVSSAAPHTDTFIGRGQVEAAATTGAFNVEAYTASRYTDGDTFGLLSVASALTSLTFEVETGGLASIGLELRGYAEWFYSEGFATLTDLTASQTLFDVAWTYEDRSIWQQTREPDSTLRVTSSSSISTMLDATHIYHLALYTQTGSNPGDVQRITMGVTGLKTEQVPEPAALTLLAAGLIAATLRRRFA